MQLHVVHRLQIQSHIVESQVIQTFRWGEQTANKQTEVMSEQMVLPQVLAVIAKVLQKQHALGL